MAATVLGMGTVLSTQDRIGEFLCPVEDDVAGGVVECAVPDSVHYGLQSARHCDRVKRALKEDVLPSASLA